MGTCLSKKSTSTNSSSPGPLPNLPDQTKCSTQVEKKKVEEETLKKEIFIIKHRKSHEIDRQSEEEKGGAEKIKVTEVIEPSSNSSTKSTSNVINGGSGSGIDSGKVVAAPVRTSSCTKEEVESILIQCGRLSRSSSTGKAGPLGSSGSSDNTNNLQCGRKYSGSKRSYDFDNEIGNVGCANEDNVGDGEEAAAGPRINRHRQRHRQSRSSSSPSHGRRRTPSRERDQQQQQQRSGSKERGGSGNGGGGRRVSRSPGRRSESPITTSSNGNIGATPSSGNTSASGNRPGKMVSVPATVSSLAMDKSNNGGTAEPISSAAIKRIQVKRNVGEAVVGTRTAASPRARSPARVRASNENQNVHSNQNQQQPVSLSRNNSRKAEQSPYRRTPLSEIDNNAVGFEQQPLPSNKTANNNQSQASMVKPNAENGNNSKAFLQGTDDKFSSKGTEDNNVTPVNSKAKGHQQLLVEEAKGLQPMTGNVVVNVVASGPESFKPQALTRSRSSRRSRDLDINPEILQNPSPSYTALLLEDIQSFHQKNTPAISLPPCVTKACSILEAVADLNSSTSSNLSCTLSDNRRRNPTTEQFIKNDNNTSLGANAAGKKRLETKDPFVESEVIVNDDLMEPSFHKYVTVRRGTVGGEDTEDQESSGSNSFVGSQHWLSSSSWEANSTGRSTSSRPYTGEKDLSPLGFERHALAEDEAPRRSNAKKREFDYQQIGIERGRVGSGKGLHTVTATIAAST